MKVLIIEDYPEIRKAFRALFVNNFNDNVSVFKFPKSLTTETIEAFKKEIRRQILLFEGEKIALATTFRIKYNSTFNNVFDVFLESILKSEKFLNTIDTILIYSYELENENESFFYSKIEELRDKFQSISFIDFETSVIFRKEPGVKLYNEKNNNIHLNSNLVKYYVNLLFYGIINLLGVRTDEGLSLINKRTRELNNFIFNFNRYYVRKTTPFKIGFLSFINPDEMEKSYGIDSPFKPYYFDINETILNRNYDLVFKYEDEYFKGFNCLYFRIYRKDNILKAFWDYPNKEKTNEQIPEYFCNKGIDPSIFFKFWIKVLYFSIYYKAAHIKNNTSVKYSYYLDKEIEVEFTTLEDIDKLCQKHIEFFWYFSELSIPAFNYKGLLNYSFFREYNDGAINMYHKETLNKQSKEIYNIDRHLLESKVFDTLYPYFNENTRSYSLLNALSTVLNRNGSHNLGSHVLAILSSEDLVKKFLEKDKNIDTTQKKCEIIYDPVYYKHLNWSGDSSKKQKVEGLVAYFNAYLKNRLDLLAAVGTSGEAVMLNNKPLFKGVFKNFERNLVLLEHISGKGEDFKYQFCLTIDDKICNETGVDIEVAMPNDLLGDQAFYLLLENIIRNTAKHGNYEINERVVFSINVNTTASNDDFYAVEIWDSNCLETRVDNENKSITEEKNKKSKANIIAETNERINNKILREDFNIREGGWGTIEMEIACCYLSGLPLRKIDDDAYRTDAKNNRLPIIYAFDKEVTIDGEKSHHLAYRFYIQKPKSVLVVDIDDQLKEDERNAKLITEKGITILTNDELNESITKRIIYKHQFMVAFAKAGTDVTAQLKEWYENKQLPNRILKINENREFEDLKNQESLINENLLDTCYSIILKGVEPTRPKDDSSNDSKYLININENFDFYDHLYPKEKFLNAKRNGGLAYQYEAKFIHHSTAKQDDKVIYCEPYGSISSLAQLLNSLEKDINYVYHSLYEAASTRVLVIDERIQNGMSKTFKPDSDSGKEVSFERIYKDTGVFVPRKDEANLNKAKEDVENIKKYIADVLRENEIDFFILHFGILEKIVTNTTKEGFKKFLSECRKTQIENPTKIVLTSGRGIPSDLPDDEYFCNFSSIDYYLSDTNGRSKAHLVQLLKNQRIK